jgi:branched-chain amino acid transport system ATP-binding protein
MNPHAPATTEPLLTVSDLTMRFGGLTAIDKLDFIARDGEITAVIGPNGAGKTTVFNCITGFYRPTSGRLALVHADGARYDLEAMAGHRIARRAHVARTFQNVRLFAGMTVLENLMVAQHNMLMPSVAKGLLAVFGLGGHAHAERHALERACFWLDAIGLIDRADDAAGALPYGAQRRLEIARAMCTSPVLLCLDEPAAGLNPRESEELSALLRRIRDGFGDLRACSILLIEHDMGVVMRISDHVVVLDHGRKISDGSPAEVRNDQRVIAAYLGEGDEDEDGADAAAEAAS